MLFVQELKKVGVGISVDAQKLLRDFDVQCTGLVCLSEEAGMRMPCEARTSGRSLAGKLSLTLLDKHAVFLCFVTDLFRLKDLLGMCSQCKCNKRFRGLCSCLYIHGFVCKSTYFLHTYCNDVCALYLTAS